MKKDSDIAQEVERYSDEIDVGGSTPSIRTSNPLGV